MRQFIRHTMSLLGIFILFAAVIVAPLTVKEINVEPQLRFIPGEMPPQSIVTEAAKQAEIYLATLETEYIPEPEPEPEPVPVPAAQSTPSVVTPPPTYSGGGSPEVWMSAAGIAPKDWGYVDFIATRESGWNPNATNPVSGACGVIQAHPCSKVPGGGYDPVSNLNWANGYAHSRYGNWENAYNFWVQNSWW